jgi:HSP20 family molecular chaperone IbpA
MSTPAKRETHRRYPDLLDWLESPFTAWLPQVSQSAPMTQAIRVEDYVEDGKYVVRAELPDIDPEKDVEITICGDVLRIHAERQTEQREGQRSEFRYGSFTRSIALPRGASAKDVKAMYDKGILTITIPIPGEKEESHRVSIESP